MISYCCISICGRKGKNGQMSMRFSRLGPREIWRDFDSFANRSERNTGQIPSPGIATGDVPRVYVMFRPSRALANWGGGAPRSPVYPGWRFALPWAISLCPVGANDPDTDRCSKKLGDCPRFFSGVRYHGPKAIVQQPVEQLLSPAKLQRKHACRAGSRGKGPSFLGMRQVGRVIDVQ